MIRCINSWPGCSRPTGAVLQLNQPPCTSALLAGTQMSSPASGSSDVREQISLGRSRERLNTRRGECHCFGDLQEGFYVLSCSLAAVQHPLWIPVPRRLLLFCLIRSTPHTPKLRQDINLWALWMSVNLTVLHWAFFFVIILVLFHPIRVFCLIGWIANTFCKNVHIPFRMNCRNWLKMLFTGFNLSNFHISWTFLAFCYSYLNIFQFGHNNLNISTWALGKNVTCIFFPVFWHC